MEGYGFNPTEVNTYESAHTPKTNIAKRIVSLVAVACSAVIFLLGIVTSTGVFYNGETTARDKSENTTVYTESKAYGGDAYTGMQQASADASNNAAAAANNVARTNEYLDTLEDNINSGAKADMLAAGLIIAVLGLISGCYFAIKFTEC